MNTVKKDLGQFFTVGSSWRTPRVKKYLKRLEKTFDSFYDPFAGNGDLLDSVSATNKYGFDIDSALCLKKGWKEQDSLETANEIHGAFITNPPYLAKNSATRSASKSSRYFENNEWQDLYQIGLSKILEKNQHGLAIVPDTFVLNPLCVESIVFIDFISITPFSDTEHPVCVVGYGAKPERTKSDFSLYQDGCFIGRYKSLSRQHSLLMKGYNIVKCRFNDPSGQIGIRAIDGTKGQKIRFCLPEDLGYDLKKISVSSRSITVVNVGEKIKDLPKFLEKCNSTLEKYRKDTYSVFLAAFKGNNLDGSRRRRLDWAVAKAIIGWSILDEDK